MSEKTTNQKITFGNPLKDEVTFNSDVETKIDDVVSKKLKAIAVWVITILLSVIFGGIIASLWELNGKVHTVIGQETVRTEIAEIHKKRIEVLNSEKILLKNEVTALKVELSKLKGVSK